MSREITFYQVETSSIATRVILSESYVFSSDEEMFYLDWWLFFH